MNVHERDGVILCGGLGKRLRGVVGDTPKVMAQVDGRPFLDFLLKYLIAQNIQRVILCTGYKADIVEDYYRGRDFGLSIEFSREQQPLGTGGALKNAAAIVSSDPFFVFNGDSFLPVPLQPFLNFHIQKNAEASLVVSRVDEGRDFGSLNVNGDFQIVEFQEKRNHSSKVLVNTGIYCFSRCLFEQMPDEKIFSLENDLFPRLLGKKFYAYYTEQEFMDIGTPQRYESARRKLREGKIFGK